MAAINTDAPRILHEGSLILLTVLGTTYDHINHLVAGSFNFTDGFRKPVEYADGGVQQVPLSGENDFSDIDCDFFIGKHATGKLHTVLRAAPTSNQHLVLQIVNFTVKIPDYRGAATGESFIWPTVWLREKLRIEGGAGRGNEDVNKIMLRLRSGLGPTIATY